MKTLIPILHLAQIGDGYDVWVSQLRQHARFSQEAPAKVFPVGHITAQQFDGNGALQGEVSPEEDAAEPARSQQAFHLVPPGDYAPDGGRIP